MKKLKLVIFIFLAVISLGVMAEDCPYSIDNASLMLSLPNKTNVKIVSTAMCNQKEYFADRFFDAEVEVWKMGKLVGKFYSRKVTYDVKNLKIILQNSLLLETEILSEKKFKDTTLVILDLQAGKLSSSKGEARF